MILPKIIATETGLFMASFAALCRKDPALTRALAETTPEELADLLLRREQNIRTTNFIDELMQLYAEDLPFNRALSHITPAQLKEILTGLDDFLHDLVRNRKKNGYDYGELMFELLDNMSKLSTDDKHILLRSTLEQAIARVSMQSFANGKRRLSKIYGTARDHAITAHSAMIGFDLGKAAEEMAYRLAKEAHSSIMTGGGPAIMEQANLGALRYINESGDTSIESIGLNIKVPHEQDPNPYQTLELFFSYFFIRKTIFSDYADVCIVFPGGFGTDDECFELLTLVQTKKKEGKLILFFDPKIDNTRMSYWDTLMAYIKEKALTKYINDTDMDLFKFVTIEEAVAEVNTFFEEKAAKDKG